MVRVSSLLRIKLYSAYSPPLLESIGATAVFCAHFRITPESEQTASRLCTA